MASQRTKQVCVRGGRSSAYLPQSPAAVSLKPDTGLYCVSWCPTCHGKEKGAGRQMHCVAWTQVSLLRTTTNRISDVPRHWSFTARNPVKTTNSSYRDFSCRVSISISRAFRGIFCAEQVGFACGELQKQCARSSRFVNSPPVPVPARANITAQGSAPRRVGPCWPSCLSTNSAGGQIECLGLGAQARQTAPAPGNQTVSGSLDVESGCGRR